MNKRKAPTAQANTIGIINFDLFSPFSPYDEVSGPSGVAPDGFDDDKPVSLTPPPPPGLEPPS